jgi:hypothetical protein
MNIDKKWHRQFGVLLGIDWCHLTELDLWHRRRPTADYPSFFSPSWCNLHHNGQIRVTLVGYKTPPIETRTIFWHSRQILVKNDFEYTFMNASFDTICEMVCKQRTVINLVSPVRNTIQKMGHTSSSETPGWLRFIPLYIMMYRWVHGKPVNTIQFP